MNCVELFSRHAGENPNRCALWLPSGHRVSFGELLENACAIQRQLLKSGLKPGESALVFLDLGVELYATVIALLGLGCPILLVEPWLSVSRIETILDGVKPRAFISGLLGRVWAFRIPSARRIPIFIQPSQVQSSARGGRLQMESLSSEQLAILTFTSGTSGGTPRGVTRTQGYLLEQLQVFEKRLHPGSVDWCIFANFAIANLGLGITSIIMDRNWSPKTFREISELPPELQPRSLTCGPAFLEQLLNQGRQFQALGEIHVGGALTDCSLFERAFRQLPSAQFTHVYGSTEAEPVALMDARTAVRLSREQGFEQTLALGKRVPEVNCDFDQDSLWVSGPHVCKKYWGNAPENRTQKRVDAAGVSWHCMGDRISQTQDGILWYRGRSGQIQEDFSAEQTLYQALGHTRAFLHRDRYGKRWVLGEGVVGQEREIRSVIPGLCGIEDVRIYRDSRHRARIDRHLSIKKGAKWLAG